MVGFVAIPSSMFIEYNILPSAYMCVCILLFVIISTQVDKKSI